MSNFTLPKRYEDKSGKYPQHDGKYKLSYSQYNSWKDVKYHNEYIKKYFCGLDVPGNMFTEFGSEVGEYKEWLGNKKVGLEPVNKMLSVENKKFLQSLEYPDNCIYEDLIVVDCGKFVIEGYIDRSWYLPKKLLRIYDFKTGSIAKKTAEYASPDYGQTTLYCYQKKQEGYIIDYSGVILFDRAGNNSVKSPIRLTEKIENIPTPYTDQRAEKLLDSMCMVAEEISENYNQYLKLFN